MSGLINEESSTRDLKAKINKTELKEDAENYKIINKQESNIKDDNLQASNINNSKEKDNINNNSEELNNGKQVKFQEDKINGKKESLDSEIKTLLNKTTTRKVIITTLRIKQNPDYRPAEEILCKIVFNKLNIDYMIIEDEQDDSHFLNLKKYIFSGRLPYLYFNTLLIPCHNIPEFLLKLVYYDLVNNKQQKKDDKEIKKENNKEADDIDMGKENNKKTSINDQNTNNNTDVEEKQNQELKSLLFTLNKIILICRDNLRSINEISISNQIKDKNKNLIKEVFTFKTPTKDIIQSCKMLQLIYSINSKAEREIRKEKINRLNNLQKQFDSSSSNIHYNLSSLNNKDEIDKFLVDNEIPKINNFNDDEIVKVTAQYCYREILKIKEKLVSPFLHIVIYSYLKDDEKIYGDKYIRILNNNRNSSSKNNNKGSNLGNQDVSILFDKVFKQITFYMDFIDTDIVKNKEFGLVKEEFTSLVVPYVNYSNLVFTEYSLSFDPLSKEKKPQDIIKFQSDNNLKHNIISLAMFFGMGGLLLYLSSNPKKTERKKVVVNSNKEGNNNYKLSSKDFFNNPFK